MNEGKLGRTYPDGAVIVREGDVGDRMFIIQSGRVRVLRSIKGIDIVMAELAAGDFFGEMALIGGEVRSATVQAVGETSLLSIDKKNFLRRVHEDPSLAYRILEHMSSRIRALNDEIAAMKADIASTNHARLLSETGLDENA